MATAAADFTPHIQMVPTTVLVPSARNARTHSPDQVAMIAASIKEFGFLNPVLMDSERGIIAGHGRVLAAKKLGMKQVPAIELGHLSEAQRRAYMIADNQIALQAGWDKELLKLEVADLKAVGFDVGLLGFGDNDLARLLGASGGHTDPDDAPPLPEAPISVAGDVWLLGNHFLMCGDATKIEDVMRLLGPVRPHLMVTDPPYGVEYDPEWRSERLAPADRAEGEVVNDAKADWREAWELFPGAVAYVWHGMLTSAVVFQSLEATRFRIRTEIIWRKSGHVISRGHYHPQHESCWYAVRDKGTAHWAGDRSQTTVWDIERPAKSETGHATQKPVECMRRPIENSSSPGQAVYEPFSGSGTTIIAAEMTGRHCYAMELNPAYVDVAILRWQEFTRQPAKHAVTGKTFVETMAERQPNRVVVGRQPKKAKPKKG